MPRATIENYRKWERLWLRLYNRYKNERLPRSKGNTLCWKVSDYCDELTELLSRADAHNAQQK